MEMRIFFGGGGELYIEMTVCTAAVQGFGLFEPSMPCQNNLRLGHTNINRVHIRHTYMLFIYAVNSYNINSSPAESNIKFWHLQARIRLNLNHLI